MNFPQAIHSGFSRIFDCRTRSSRSEYWYWYLVFFIVNGLMVALIFPEYDEDSMHLLSESKLWDFLLTLFMTALMWSVTVRRLHDLGWSGWWMLLIYVMPTFLDFAFLDLRAPFPSEPSGMYLTILWLMIFMGIGFLILFCIKGTTGANRFGDDPLSSS